MDSPLVMYREFHFFFFSFLLKIIFPVVYLFIMSLLHHVCIISERMGIIVPLQFVKRKFCENICTLPMGSFPLWHHKFWRSCQLEGVHNKDLLKLQKSRTPKPIVQFCSNVYCNIMSSWYSPFPESMWMSGFHWTLTLSPLGGGQIDPPLYKIFRCRATAADRVTIFGDFFHWSIAHLLEQILRKSDHRSRGHVEFHKRMSTPKFTKTCIFHTFVCKTAYFINCSKTQLFQSSWPFTRCYVTSHKLILD